MPIREPLRVVQVSRLAAYQNRVFSLGVACRSRVEMLTVQRVVRGG